MTQNATQAKNSRSFAEQSVFVSSIPSSMIKKGKKVQGIDFLINLTYQYILLISEQSELKIQN